MTPTNPKAMETNDVIISHYLCFYHKNSIPPKKQPRCFCNAATLVSDQWKVRYRKVRTSAREQMPSGTNLVAVTPVVMLFSTAQRTASA